MLTRQSLSNNNSIWNVEWPQRITERYDESCVYVGNMDPNYPPVAQLYDLFGRYGPVLKVETHIRTSGQTYNGESNVNTQLTNRGRTKEMLCLRSFRR